MKVRTSWRAKDWLDVLKEEVEPHIKHITFEKGDEIINHWNEDTRAYDIPKVVDWIVMIVVEDENFEKENFKSILKDGSDSRGDTQLGRDLQYGIKHWVYENIGHRI